MPREAVFVRERSVCVGVCSRAFSLPGLVYLCIEGIVFITAPSMSSGHVVIVDIEPTPHIGRIIHTW